MENGALQNRSHWLTPKEVAAELGIPKYTVYRLLTTNRLRYYRMSKQSIRIDPESVSKWQSCQTVEAC